MEKVILSNGYEYELVTNAVSVGADTLSVTFKPGEDLIETIEEKWTGNDLIKIVVGEQSIGNYTGYTAVKSVTKVNEYPDGIDEDGNETYIVACTVVVAKANLETRVSDVENAVENIIDSIL